MGEYIRCFFLRIPAAHRAAACRWIQKQEKQETRSRNKKQEAETRSRNKEAETRSRNKKQKQFESLSQMFLPHPAPFPSASWGLLAGCCLHPTHHTCVFCT